MKKVIPFFLIGLTALIAKAGSPALAKIEVPIFIVSLAYDDGTGATRAVEYMSHDLPYVNELYKDANIIFKVAGSVQINSTRYRDPQTIEDQFALATQYGLIDEWDAYLEQVDLPERAIKIFYPNSLPDSPPAKPDEPNRGWGFAGHKTAVVYQSGRPARTGAILTAHEIGHTIGLSHTQYYPEIPEEEGEYSFMNSPLYIKTNYILHPVLIVHARMYSANGFDSTMEVNFSDIKIAGGKVRVEWMIEPSFKDRLQSSTDLITWDDIGEFQETDYHLGVHEEPLRSRKIFRIVRQATGRIEPQEE